MRKTIHRAALGLDTILDRRYRAACDERTIIIPYRGFGRPGELFIRGRVVGGKLITRARESEPVWRSLVNAYRRFQSDEVGGANVNVAIGDSVLATVTNDEGYFEARLAPTTLQPSTLWHRVRLELPENGFVTTGEVMVPGESARFGIISDIDDTIVRTGATSLRSMIRSVAFENASMRMPFEGVAELYDALHASENPLFYVSSSPWNLYDLIADFMEINRIPHGAMFLQDWGIDTNTFIIAEHATHKLREIQAVLAFYPALKFILIGDSGQHDPEIYREVIRSNPGRVLASFIRDVTEEARDRSVGEIAEEVQALGAPMFFVRDSAHALEMARGAGLIELVEELSQEK